MEAEKRLSGIFQQGDYYHSSSCLVLIRFDFTSVEGFPWLVGSPGESCPTPEMDIRAVADKVCVEKCSQLLYPTLT